MNIAFIGLGVMGSPMAAHLLKANKDMLAYNRTATRALDWKKHFPTGAIATESSIPINHSHSSEHFSYQSLESLIPEMDVILSCIGKDEDVSELGEKIQALGKPGLIWVDHTTTSSELAKTLHKKLQTKDIGFIDAPVSGGEAGAKNGVLSAMCGGDDKIFQKITPIIKAYCKNIVLVGQSGSGQLTKMMNQICLAGVLQGLSEALHFGKEAGLDCKKAIEAISKGAAQSWQMDNRAKTMIEGQFDFGFAIDLMQKDLAICLNQAARLKTPLPIAMAVNSLYKKEQDKGNGKLDTSALIKQFET
jgi:3-hydroxyisobutyrate dehydrogenase